VSKEWGGSSGKGVDRRDIDREEVLTTERGGIEKSAQGIERGNMPAWETNVRVKRGEKKRGGQGRATSLAGKVHRGTDLVANVGGSSGFQGFPGAKSFQRKRFSIISRGDNIITKANF